MGELAAEGERADEAEERAAELQAQILDYQFHSAQRYLSQVATPLYLLSCSHLICCYDLPRCTQ